MMKKNASRVAVIVANALCFAKVVDPQKAAYGVVNYAYAVTSLTMTSLRAIVGAMELDEALSSREQEVLELIARGFSYAEIARIKAISVHTVQTHIKGLYSKLAVHSKNEAVYEATRIGLL